MLPSTFDSFDESTLGAFVESTANARTSAGEAALGNLLISFASAATFYLAPPNTTPNIVIGSGGDMMKYLKSAGTWSAQSPDYTGHPFSSLAIVGSVVYGLGPSTDEAQAVFRISSGTSPGLSSLTWETTTGAQPLVHKIFEHQGALIAIGRFELGGVYGQVFRYDGTAWTNLAPFAGAVDDIVSHQGSLYACRNAESVKIWNGGTSWAALTLPEIQQVGEWFEDTCEWASVSCHQLLSTSVGLFGIGNLPRTYRYRPNLGSPGRPGTLLTTVRDDIFKIVGTTIVQRGGDGLDSLDLRALKSGSDITNQFDAPSTGSGVLLFLRADQGVRNHVYTTNVGGFPSYTVTSDTIQNLTGSDGIISVDTGTGVFTDVSPTDITSFEASSRAPRWFKYGSGRRIFFGVTRSGDTTSGKVMVFSGTGTGQTPTSVPTWGASAVPVSFLDLGALTV